MTTAIVTLVMIVALAMIATLAMIAISVTAPSLVISVIYPRRGHVACCLAGLFSPLPMTSIPPTHPQPRSIPIWWIKLKLENQSPEFPALSHSKVPEGHRTIYFVIVSIDPVKLHCMITHGAKLSSFCGLDEAAAKGSLLFLFSV